MKERPILFNTDMVKAIVEGRKTQTRRVIKFPDGMTGRLPERTLSEAEEPYIYYPGGIKRPPYHENDILYVRETWWKGDLLDESENIVEQNVVLYKADEPNIPSFGTEEYSNYKWSPSIHMPKEAARIFLKVTSLRVERLHDITEDEIKLEGIRAYTKDSSVWKYSHLKEFDWGNAPRTATEAFIKLWDTCCSKWKYKWNYNPWVWVIEFERVEGEEEE